VSKKTQRSTKSGCYKSSFGYHSSRI